MEEWELEFEWLQVRHFVKNIFHRNELPDLQAILFLIGIQEANVRKSSFTKEEKQDLMHVATCHLLTQQGFFEFLGEDTDGWPHYNQVKTIPAEGMKAQENLLKSAIINYFKYYEDIIVQHEN